MGMRITAQSQKDFDSLLTEMVKFTGVERGKVMFNTTIDMVFSLIGATPAARKGTPNRGFAKQAYVWAARSLGKTPRADFPGVSNASKQFQRVLKTEGADKTGFIIENTVPFIEDLDQGTINNVPANINAVAINNTSEKLARRLDVMESRQFKKWNR